MSDAITYQHDDEARRGTLAVQAAETIDRRERIMSDAIHYDHDDPEARLSWLTFTTTRMENGGACKVYGDGTISLRLSDDEAIALYELLRAQWAGYVAERDEAAAAVRRGVPLAEYIGDWREQREQELRDIGPDESFGAYVDSGAADLYRDMERGK